MAHRKHVILYRQYAVVAACLLSVVAHGCSRGEAPRPTENRGRVIDQDTGTPIAGALVVGKYMGSIAWGGGTCDRIESATSDQDGWFTIPNNSTGQPPFMQAYVKGYAYGNRPRVAFNGVNGDPNKWQVQVQQWDADNRHAKLVSTEPTIYHSQREAEEVSRQWKDVYLRRFKGDREERIMDLSGLTGGGSCDGGPQTTSGPIEFLKAIYSEQVELGASESQLRHTRSVMETALSSMARAKARDAAKQK